MAAKIKVIIKRTDEQYGHMTHISPRLENLQKTVGGYIETVLAFGGALIICNEEGKIKGLPVNMPLRNDMLVGDIIVVGAEHEEFSDVPITFAEWKAFVDQQEGRN